MQLPETSSNARVTVDGRFFRIGTRKFHPKGVTYGPFAPSAQGGAFPSRTQVLLDFDLVQQLGANLLRVYDVPPRWFLDLAAAHDLRVFIDIPWSRHLCFLDSAEQRRAAMDAVGQAVRVCQGHPAVFAYSVANEIPTEIVRWHGARRTARFLDTLMAVARENDPGCLCTFTSFPPTEFLRPETADFTCFNVFLHERRAWEAYLARLQMQADTRPLLIGECGLDSIREGEGRKAEILSWQIETAFRGGVAGLVVFSFTDDWHRGGQAVEDWAFGLTTRERAPKESFRAVQRQFRAAPYYRLPRVPKVSVVIACYNGQRTLKTCLDAVSCMNYPDYEIVLVDDGSTDGTSQVAMAFPGIEYVRQEHHGLSVARNTGIAAAQGEIIAFTDADCRPDEDWLYYVVGDLLRDGFAGMGGHNFLPPDDSRVAAAVMASPGGPAHVMLTDREAEHIPGCNMVFWRWAMDEIGGFDPLFRQAGDDVDVCWRLQERGRRLGFSPGGFVWHYRRSTVAAYLGQQFGYGEAEALLARKHPEYFNTLGSSIWRGRIYAGAPTGASLRRPVIYRGVFGTAPFQRLYDPAPGTAGTTWTSLEWHALVTLPLLAIGLAFPLLLPLALASLALSLGSSLLAAIQAPLPPAKRAFWSRPLIAWLGLLQPVVRGWARYRSRFTARSIRPTTFRRQDATRSRWTEWPSTSLAYWTSGPVERVSFLRAVLAQLRTESWEWRADTGWADHDVEIYGKRWSRARLTTATEDLGHGRRVLRCRLQTGWSLAANWSLGLLLGVQLAVQITFAPAHPWLLLALLLFPALALLAEHERRVTLGLLIALVEETARRLQFVRLHAATDTPASEASKPTPPPRDPAEDLL